MNWLRKLILRALDIGDHEGRLKDIERHFVLRRDQTGQPTQTLADVPLEKRKELQKPKRAGMSTQQYIRWLEATDGGRRAPVEERLPSIS